MSDTAAWVRALRASHGRLTRLLASLDDRGLTDPSYARGWTIADVLSHLGSQSEIYGSYLDAGLTGETAPGPESFPAIWDRWNALPDTEKVAESLRVNDELVTRLEQLTPAQRESFSVTMFGFDADLARFVEMRLGEHAVHTWDIAVSLDRTATIADDAVVLLVDTLDRLAAHAGHAVEGAEDVVIGTTEPAHRFTLSLSPTVRLTPDTAGTNPAPGVLHLPAEALIRLVCGRLDPVHTPEGVADIRLTRLRGAFPGF